MDSNDATVRITIHTGNEAFTDQRDDELARIFRHLAERLEAGRGLPSKIMDLNGNHVGTVLELEDRQWLPKRS